MSDNAVSINVDVTFRHTESTEALKEYATEKIGHCLLKYAKSETEAHVILSVEKRDHVAEVNVHWQRFDLSCKAIDTDLYAAIDKLVDTLVAQLRKHKEKLNDKRSARAA